MPFDVSDLSAHQLARRGELDVLRSQYKVLGAAFVQSEASVTRESPLHAAARHDHGTVVQALVREMGVHVNGTDKWGRTALHIAAHHASLGAMRALAAVGALFLRA